MLYRIGCCAWAGTRPRTWEVEISAATRIVDCLLTFQCFLVGRSVTVGNKSRSHPPLILLSLSPVERRLRRWMTPRPVTFMKVLLLELRRLLGWSQLEQPVLVRLSPWVKSLFGRSTAGMYMGRL